MAWNYFYVAISFSFIGFLPNNSYRRLMVILVCTVAGYCLIRSIALYCYVNQRMRQMPAVSEQYNVGSEISQSALSYELNKVDNIRKLRGVVDQWQIYDAVYNFHRKTKYGSYLSKRVYYTVFEAQLIRQVPHLIFDSRTAKGRQFKTLYLQSQRLSLEGNFNQFFEAYSPENYQIDTLSFITPEVMEALVALKDYDIELIGDHVLCAGPLLEPIELDQLETFGQLLVKALNGNLKTYRDDRLTGQARKAAVTPFARALLKSPRRYLPPLIISGIGIVISVALAVTVDRSFLFDQIALIADVVFITALINMINVVRKNRRLEAKYRQLYKR